VSYEVRIVVSSGRIGQRLPLRAGARLVRATTAAPVSDRVHVSTHALAMTRKVALNMDCNRPP
jgi:hypothetical protein